ncbi:fluoride efflux transporter FluC [Bifidobacterium vespertilionis]|uniref:fluoride efflux transporter FluC n=1 Tax=Bifidobacterium vespertilionis TaxID=2562524 RepID=UPI001F0A0603|nr:CrcB family protein [Bifidobacterium vespertilionis]
MTTSDNESTGLSGLNRGRIVEPAATTQTIVSPMAPASGDVRGFRRGGSSDASGSGSAGSDGSPLTDIVLYLVVFLGGCVGTAMRYGISLAIPNTAAQSGLLSVFHTATFVANMLACFIFAWLTTSMGRARWIPARTRELVNRGVGMGMCGGFSTLSAMVIEELMSWRGGNIAGVAFYEIVSFACGLAVAYGGAKLALAMTASRAGAGAGSGSGADFGAGSGESDRAAGRTAAGTGFAPVQGLDGVPGSVSSASGALGTTGTSPIAAGSAGRMITVEDAEAAADAFLAANPTDIEDNEATVASGMAAAALGDAHASAPVNTPVVPASIVPDARDADPQSTDPRAADARRVRTAASTSANLGTGAGVQVARATADEAPTEVFGRARKVHHRNVVKPPMLDRVNADALVFGPVSRNSQVVEKALPKLVFPSFRDDDVDEGDAAAEAVETESETAEVKDTVEVKDPSATTDGVRPRRTVAALAAAPLAYGQPTGLSELDEDGQDDGAEAPEEIAAQEGEVKDPSATLRSAQDDGEGQDDRDETSEPEPTVKPLFVPNIVSDADDDAPSFARIITAVNERHQDDVKPTQRNGEAGR